MGETAPTIRDPAGAPVEADAQATDLVVGAVGAHQRGELDAAEVGYRAALALVADHPHALHYLGVLHHQRGENDPAVALIEQAIAKQPDYADFHINLGAIHFKTGETRKAVEAFERAVALNPQSAEAHSNLAAALIALGRHEDAIHHYEAAHRADPATPKFVKRLGDLHLEREDFARAIEWFERYLDYEPEDAEAHSNLGYAQERIGHHAAAERSYRRADELAPDSPEIINNLAGALARLGRTDEAEDAYARALACDTAKWTKLANLAAALVNRGDAARALPIYDRLVADHPDDASLHNDRGIALLRAGRADDAAEALRTAVAIDPDYAEAYNSLGSAEIARADRNAGIVAFKEAVRAKPDYADPYMNVCLPLLHQNRYDEAYFYAHAAPFVKGYCEEMFSNPNKVFRALCDFEAIEQLGDLWSHVEHARISDISANFLEMLVLADSPQAIDRLVGLHRKWGENATRLAERDALPPIEARRTRKKIRVAFVSSDLRGHSVAKHSLPIFELYDRNRFEVFCYTPYEVHADPVQQKIKGLVDGFRLVRNRSYREVAEVLRGDEIDVAFELNGFTRDSKLRSFAYRPAPIQLAWLGYPFTTGLPTMDHFLIDRLGRPENPDWLVEEPAFMPKTWVCLGNFPPMASSDRPPMAENGFVTFGTMNNPYKYTAAMLDLWCRVMERVPGSRFLIVRPEVKSVVFCRNITKEFERRGIAAERLDLVDNVSLGVSNLQFYDQIDITLDTYPVTGGTTTCDAMWMGTPVVALVGPNLHNRLGYSLMSNAGIEELCTFTPEDFVDKAVWLAGQHQILADIKLGLREAILHSPLCDLESYVRDFQDVIEDLVLRHGLR